VERDECFDLPKHPDIPIHFDLEESGQVYDDMAEEMVAELKEEGVAEASIPLVAAMKLSQITSGWTKNTEGKIVQVGSEKLEVATNLLEDWFDSDEKIVVAARWRWDIAKLVAFCQKQKVPVFELHGGIARVDRDAGIKQFRALRKQPACFIMQPSAGSLGIDLRTATMYMWYSLTNSYVDFTQGNDRVGLAEHSVPFNYLIARNTVDQVLYDSLQEDGQVVKAIQRSPDRLLRSFKR
jgi:superfamily II DNA/RNA helicase